MEKVIVQSEECDKCEKSSGVAVKTHKQAHTHTQTCKATICHVRKMKNMINNGCGSLTQNLFQEIFPL